MRDLTATVAIKSSLVEAYLSCCVVLVIAPLQLPRLVCFFLLWIIGVDMFHVIILIGRIWFLKLFWLASIVVPALDLYKCLSNYP